MARKLTVEELKNMIQEELEDPKDPAQLKVKAEPWERAEPAGKIDWIKNLSIKEMFRFSEADDMTKLLPRSKSQLPKVVGSQNGQPDLRKMSYNDAEQMFKNKQITQQQFDQYKHYWQVNNPYTDQQLCHCPECTAKMNSPFVDPRGSDDDE